jgi:small subunit ribosomal protein S15
MSTVVTTQKPNKAAIIKQTQKHESDTGSSAVQIAILSQEIINLTEHLKINPRDFSSRRGLLKKVGKRRSLLRHLATVSVDEYNKVLAANNLKG